jgi:Bacterial SH3 domain
MALALPKLRWLVIGAIAAGVWVVREDMKGPRPPERIPPAKTERSTQTRPKPPKPLAAKPAQPKQAELKTAWAKPVPPQSVAQKSLMAKPAIEKTALALPKTVDRPPSKPQKIVTGSISRPDKPTFVQTKSKVFMRAQAKADAPIIATLRPRSVMRELARSGEWRLVMGDGRKGWVRADYLAKSPVSPRRPKLPVADVKQATASAKPAKAR